MRFHSPLRYPGGKAKLSSFISTLCDQNELSGGTYIEPYCGGAAVALDLLFNQRVSKIVINDLDRSIYAFWHCVLNETDQFCGKIKRYEVNLKNWEKQRVVQLNKEKVSLFDLGFSTFFLNRTNRSGIIKGGVIGGKGQKGKWKIDARYNKKALIERIQKIATFRKTIDLHNVDAIELVNKTSKNLSRKAFIYFDPPYYQKGESLYKNHYKPHDHSKVAESILKIKKVSWMVSYDSCPEIKGFYRGMKQREYHLNYSATKASKGKEVLIFSDDLKVPATVL